MINGIKGPKVRMRRVLKAGDNVKLNLGKSGLNSVSIKIADNITVNKNVKTGETKTFVNMGGFTVEL